METAKTLETLYTGFCELSGGIVHCFAIVRAPGGLAPERLVFDAEPLHTIFSLDEPWSLEDTFYLSIFCIRAGGYCMAKTVSGASVYTAVTGLGSETLPGAEGSGRELLAAETLKPGTNMVIDASNLTPPAVVIVEARSEGGTSTVNIRLRLGGETLYQEARQLRAGDKARILVPVNSGSAGNGGSLQLVVSVAGEAPATVRVGAAEALPAATIRLEGAGNRSLVLQLPLVPMPLPGRG